MQVALEMANPDDIRAAGWSVAIHNDYRIDGVPHTFWLFTQPILGRYVKGEGRTDAEALNMIRKIIWTRSGIDLEPPDPRTADTTKDFDYGDMIDACADVDDLAERGTGAVKAMADRVKAAERTIFLLVKAGGGSMEIPEDDATSFASTESLRCYRDQASGHFIFEIKAPS